MSLQSVITELIRTKGVFAVDDIMVEVKKAFKENVDKKVSAGIGIAKEEMKQQVDAIAIKLDISEDRLKTLKAEMNVLEDQKDAMYQAGYEDALAHVDIKDPKVITRKSVEEEYWHHRHLIENKWANSEKTAEDKHWYDNENARLDGWYYKKLDALYDRNKMDLADFEITY